MTMTGYADPDELDEPNRRALEMAAGLMCETFAHEACQTRPSDVLDPDSTMAECLPRKHRLRYSRRFAFDFLGALYVVLDRLADRHHSGPVCNTTAQELAFRGLIETAGTLLEGTDDSGLREFYDLRVEDTDIEWLFDPAMDGAEDSTLLRNMTDPANLAFDRWFEPFGGSWPPAPEAEA